MQNSIAAGRRLAARVVAVQFAATMLLALGFLLQGWRSGLAAFSGGGAVVLGTALLALRMFAAGPAPAGMVMRRLIAGNLLKWGVIVLGLYLAFAAQLPGLPLLTGLATVVLVPHFYALHESRSRRV